MTSGKLTQAIQDLDSVKKRWLWHILCNNEGFLDAKVDKAEHAAKSMKLWHIPKSRDLNHIETVWAQLGKQLRAVDLADAMAKRPVLGKTAYKQRVRQVGAKKNFQAMAGFIALGLKKTCRLVVAKSGAATGW